MNALLIIALSTLAAREPIETPAPKPDEGVVFLAPLAEKSPADRHVGLSTGIGLLALSPSLELEIAPMNHVSFYAGGEFSAVRLGYAGQAGFRLRPMEGLIGPFLDLHVRFSRFQSLLNVLPELSETASPGAMFGFTLVSQQGFTFSAGLGASFLAKTTETRYQLTTRDTPLVPLPQVDSTTTTKVGPVPELRINVGVAL